MKIAIGSDHAGFELKSELKERLLKKGVELMDEGTDSKDSVDYPDFALKVCEKIINGKAERGILICATGIGMSIAANKIPGIRAALVLNEMMAERASTHNHANVICLGALFTSPEEGERLIERWLNTPFSSEERHRRRIEKISKIVDRYK